MERTLYFGGDIITMEHPMVTTNVLVENGTIAAVGKEITLAEAEKEGLCLFDLEGKTMMPAFLDSHSHLSAFAQTLGFVSLKGVENIEQMRRRLEDYIENNSLESGEWVIGFGYDHTTLTEKNHPEKEDLQFREGGHPVLVSHISGHMGVINETGLHRLHIDETTQNPKEGKIGRKEDSMEPNGYLEEGAFFALSQEISVFSEKKRKRQMKQAQEIYLKNGIVLAQEGLVSPKEAEVLENTNLLLDVMGYVDMTKRDSFALFHQRIFHSNGGQLAFLGYKLILDGSPQGKTAWLEQPYEGEETYCGYPVHTDEAVTAYCRIALKEQMQLLVHCNGDGAVKQLLRCYEAAKQMEKPKKDIRLVMVHGQILPRECLPKVKELGIIPSFFVDHTYEWGDLHRKKLGKRSAFISPVKTALHLGIPATLHQDTPVLLPNMICTLWCATNRKTKSGVVLGKEECLSTLEALECVTKNAAYQYFAEQKRGSISVGKNADFVILSENPLEKKVENLRDIFVVTTIKGGKVLYQKE